MKTRGALYAILLLISALTVLSGLGQMLMPGLVLDLLSVQGSPAAQHFFGIIGMFMLLFGGAAAHALLSPDDQPIVVLWAGLQKFGASAAVGLGVLHAIFSPLALAVAGFDLLSGVLALAYWWRIRP
jgi:hypothetical protein